MIRFKKSLFTALPNKLRFTTESLSHVLDENSPISELYTTTNGHFTIGEILEAVRSFTEQEYNKIFSDKKYTFNDLFFTGVSQLSSNMFELKWENTNQSMLGTLGPLDVLGGLNNGPAFGQLMNMMLGM